LKDYVITDIPQHQSRRAYSTRNIFSQLNSPSWSRTPHFWGFDNTIRHTALGGTLLDERPVRRRDLNLTTHNTHNIKYPSPLLEGSQINALDRVATGIGTYEIKHLLKPTTCDSCNSHKA